VDTISSDKVVRVTQSQHGWCLYRKGEFRNRQRENEGKTHRRHHVKIRARQLSGTKNCHVP
jgi:hypothetical protein